jgi:hypothetical protein
LEGVKVQLDSEDIITIQQKHLVAAPDAPRDDEVANSGQVWIIVRLCVASALKMLTDIFCW